MGADFCFSFLNFFNLAIFARTYHNSQRQLLSRGKQAHQGTSSGWAGLWVGGLLGRGVSVGPGLFIIAGVVLGRLGVTLLKSLMRVAYSEGTLLRLGGSAHCSRAALLEFCSSLMNLFISNLEARTFEKLMTPGTGCQK